MRRLLAGLVLVGFAVSLGGCVYYPPGSGAWCYYHPHQCPPPPPPPPPPSPPPPPPPGY